jgi:hypothetical protein
VAGGWRLLHNEELHNLYASPNIIRVFKSRKMRWVRHVAHMGKMRNGYKILVRKPEVKRPLRRPRHIWEDSTRMNLGGVDWIYLIQDRDQWWSPVNMVMNLQVL